MMARHTHIVSLGLFHKTFHSSLLQETFCFLMYDVLLSIYKINLIKKNKSCGICLATFYSTSSSKDHYLKIKPYNHCCHFQINILLEINSEKENSYIYVMHVPFKFATFLSLLFLKISYRSEATAGYSF